MAQSFFDQEFNYWGVARTVKDIYMSNGAMNSLLDFERVLDELDIYAFPNWELGEIVAGPDVGRYRVSCIFMWPLELMPDPRGGKRLLPFDCDVRYKKTTIKVPVKIKTPDDYQPGTRLARVVEKAVWFVEIEMPKALMSDISTGAIEIEGETIDLADLDAAYEEDLDQQEFKQGQQPQDQGQPVNDQPAPAIPGL